MKRRDAEKRRGVSENKWGVASGEIEEMPAVSIGITLAQYLEHEARTGEGHEYYRGELFAMVGGTPRHALIAANFLGKVSQLLKGKPCIAYTGDRPKNPLPTTDESISILGCSPEAFHEPVLPKPIVDSQARNSLEIDRISS